MASVAEIDALAERLYASADNGERQQAMQTLEASTVEGADVSIFDTILRQSQSQYSLLFAAQGLVRWFRANGKYLDADQRRDLIVNRCGQCLQRIAVTTNAPRHVLMSLVSMYAKLTKFTFEREPYLTEAVADVVYLVESSYAQCHSRLGAPAPPVGDGGVGGASTGGSNDEGTVEENLKVYFLALLLLDGLVVEFSKYDSAKAHTYMNFAAHRRCSNNFRDECMLDIFRVSLRQLELLTDKGFVGEVVDLAKDCLTYDFMAIMVDETEEALSAQFPTTWKELLLTPHTQDILWNQHRALPYPHCEALLSGLTSVCGIRRTFFDTLEDRVAYIDATLDRLVDIMASPPPDYRLANPHYVNTFGEACTRLIAPFGYRDLHQSRAFLPWVKHLFELSQQVFATPFGKSGSFTTATTLLTFWARLCTSRRMFASNDEQPSEMEELAPSLALCIFRSRVHTLNSFDSGGGGGNKENADGMASGTNINIDTNNSSLNNNNSSSTPRCSSNEDLALMGTLMDDMDGALEAVLSQAEALGSIAVLEQKTTMQTLAAYAQQQLGPAVLNSPLSTGWLFFMAGSLVRHVLNNLNDEAMEGCGSFFMFCVDCASHRRLSGGSVVNLSPDPATNTALGNFVEKGLLHMLTNMQNVFTGIRQHSSLSLIVTNIFQSRAQLFQFILDNTGGNMLRSPSGTADEETADIMRASIELIDEAVREVSSSILAELSFDLPPVVQLPLSQSISTYKLRTNLYHILWPLNVVRRSAIGSGGGSGGPHGGKGERPYTSDVLQRFLRPIAACMQTTMTSSEGTSPIYVAGWLRDLRGVALALQDDATNGPQAFCDFIEWFCDEYSVFESVIASPVGQSPIVTTSFLRFMMELVNTRGGRIALPGLTNHAILGLSLFKNMCQFTRQIVERCITEERIQAAVQAGAAADSAHDYMMKPLSLAMTCLRKCVGDSIVPLGAMWFYQDDTYDTTLLGLLRMLGVFPISLFKSYPDTTFAVVDLLRTVTEDGSYQPISRLSGGDLQVVLNFVIAVCEDTDTATGTLIHGLSFLGFIAGFVRDVKTLSLSPALQSGTALTPSSSLAAGAGGGGVSTPPPPSPMQLPQYYAMPGTGGRLSGTPGRGNNNNNNGGAGHPPSRLAREARAALARTLEPMSDLWIRLISVGMNVIVLQDRAMSASCTVVYPIMETYPPFWQQFVDGFVPTYPQAKQQRVREALSTLLNNAESSEKFFSEVFTLRQTLRNL